VRRIDTELPNLRGAWHRAPEAGELKVAARITVALGEHGFYGGRAELWGWARRLAAYPGLTGSPLEAAVLGEASQAAWLQGHLTAAEDLALRGLEAAAPTTRAAGAAWRAWPASATSRRPTPRPSGATSRPRTLPAARGRGRQRCAA
jgi:hypothetical protein